MKSLIPLLLLTVLLPCVSRAEDPVCVTKNKTKLRKGPSAKDAVTWTVGKNMPLLKVGEKGKWFKVKDLENHTHWIHSSNVSSRFFCAVIRAKTANLRQGPGKEFPLAELGQVDRYTPFKKVDRDGEWLLLQDSFKAQYWVHEANVWLPMSRASVSF